MTPDRGICLAGAISIATALATTPAVAGFWNFGCKGSLGNKVILFDRDALVILPPELADGKLHGLSKGTIRIYEAYNTSEGLLPAMKFASASFPDQQVLLTEISSRKTSETRGHVGTREENTTDFRKRYRYQEIGIAHPLVTEVVLDCLDYQMTAP